MKLRYLLLTVFVLCGVLSAGAQEKTISKEMLQKLEKARTSLSAAHQWMLFEDFASSGVYAAGYIEAPAQEPLGSGVTQPQGTASDNLQAAADDLPDTYTIWIQTPQNWFVSVRKGDTAVFLKLAADGGDMDFGHGSGWCIQPKGSGFIKYPYKNGSWGAAQKADEARQEIGLWQQEYILTPAGDMGGDRVRLFEKAAYFDDLDITLPKQ